MLEFIVPALQNLLTIENLIWINLGVFIGSVFAAIPGLTVILCIILFLPFTYQMTAIPGMMFLLGIYCAGGYGGSVSAILINTPGTPHAAATMLDGYPLNQKGRTKAALKIALYASTFGGIFSALIVRPDHHRRNFRRQPEQGRDGGLPRSAGFLHRRRPDDQPRAPDLRRRAPVSGA